jgi:hypothetical protein
MAVEHLQNGILFFFESVILKADGVFDDPVDSYLLALAARFQIGPLANRQLT